MKSKLLENQKITPRRNAGAFMMPEPYLSQHKKRKRLEDRICWAVLIFAFLYFGMHIAFWAMAGFPVRGM